MQGFGSFTKPPVGMCKIDLDILTGTPCLESGENE